MSTVAAEYLQSIWQTLTDDHKLSEIVGYRNELRTRAMREVCALTVLDGY
ncbi:MAG: hypothetical protein QXO57_00380 [Candidatus Aenigmatarchaeota archaeon]